jgi:cytochrome d ubiquinol oxidase subunit II
MLELVPDLTQRAGWLPLAFMVVMGLSILAYVILDGYDLGVGILMQWAGDEQKDQMLASIGPFWDANETWLVLGVGILLVAFPAAHGLVLGELYLPATFMLVGLTLRGVSFEFRAKAAAQFKASWDGAFFTGSLLAALAQGYMLGRLVLGFAPDLASHVFAAFIGLSLASGYAVLGAAWLILKTEGVLQLRAINWARHAMALLGGGVIAVSIATPLVSERIMAKWFTVENMLVLWPMPLMTGVAFFIAWRSLDRLPIRLAADNHYGDWVPFAATVGIFALAFHGLAYSLFPYIVMDKLTIWDAAAAPESLMVIFIGAMIVLPVIIGYSVFAYRVFGGKATALDYG